MINIELMRKGYYTRAYNNTDNTKNIDNTKNTDNNRIQYYRISNGFKEANDAVIKFNKDKTKS